MKSKILSLVLLGLLMEGCVTVESPKYQVLQANEEFEIRQYNPVIVAETFVTSEFSDAGTIGFRRLADYIFGANTTQAKIAMTAPVAQTPASEKIAMTAPVGQTPARDGFVISFNMPAGYTLESLPRPRDSAVTLRQTSAQKVAAIKFTGTWSESRYHEKLAKLRQWMEKKSLQEAGPPTYARYDPPWTLWFLRRNEILVEIRQ